MQIIRISDVLKQQYGSKVQKLSLSSGCTCPNRDGSKGWGGCSFCSEGGSGEFASSFAPIGKQIEQAKKLVDKKFPAALPEKERKYIAYFQSFTNTYGNVARLSQLYHEVIRRPEIVILSVATRPDCLSDDMIKMLAELNCIKPVWVELGLQTIHERTAVAIRRAYSLDVFDDAYRRLTIAGLAVIVHVILGLPGETAEDMLETVRYLSALKPVLPGIKIQLLHILKGTGLEEEYRSAPFHLMDMEEYTDLVVEFLKLLPEETIIHRMTGDPPRKLLVAPQWSTDKKRVLNTLNCKIKNAVR